MRFIALGIYLLVFSLNPCWAVKKDFSRHAFDNLYNQEVITIYPGSSPGSSAPWLKEAEKWVGATAQQLGVRPSLWCAAGLNKWLDKAGVKGTKSDRAASFAKFGKKSEPVPGAIAVMHRGKGGGGHVAIVVKDLGNKVLTISANYSNKVSYATYSKSSIYAYRWPA